MIMWLARRGFFYYEGFFQQAPGWMPKARVKYGNGLIAEPMPVGNALAYASMFGGEVHLEPGTGFTVYLAVSVLLSLLALFGGLSFGLL